MTVSIKLVILISLVFLVILVILVNFLSLVKNQVFFCFLLYDVAYLQLTD